MDSKTKKKFIQNASSQSENLTTKTSRRIWGILICYQKSFSIYSSVTFHTSHHFVLLRKKYAAKILKIISYCFTAIAKRCKPNLMKIKNQREYLHCSSYDTKNFINDIFGIRFLYYEYGLIFGVDLYIIDFFQIQRTLVNDFKLYQQTHRLKSSARSDSKCQQTHSLHKSVGSDSKCHQTHSLLQRSVINDSKCQRTHSQLQRILLVDSSLNLYLTHC